MTPSPTTATQTAGLERSGSSSSARSLSDSLAAYQQQFDGLRSLEKNAPANLEAVRRAIATTTARLAAAERTAGELKNAYERGDRERRGTS